LFWCSWSQACPAQEKRAKGSGGPNKAYLQKIWDGWAALDPSTQGQYYAQGPHTFYDIAAAQIQQLGRVQKGVVNVLADFKSAKFTVNDDAEIYPAGDHAWGFATVKEDATMKSGKREVATIRWTFVLRSKLASG